MIRIFAAICLFLATPAFAADIPFFLPYPKLDTGRWYIAHGWKNNNQQSCEWRKESITVHEGSLRLELSDKGGKIADISCAEVQTKRTFHYGMYAVRMKPASGSGLNSAFFTYIGPAQGLKGEHDEIDFEFLGKNTKKVQLNYYVKGKPQGETFIELGFDASEDFHDYSFVWEPTRIRWYIDGKQVHETKKGAAIPSHESKIFLTLWSGTPKVNGWLGPFEFSGDKQADFASVSYTPLPAQ